MQNALVNVNGQILNPDQAKVSVFDRSYLYGDSLYEVIRTYDRKTFGMPEHLKRLEKSADLCRMVLGQKMSEYEAEIEKTLAEFYKRQPNAKEAYIRIIVSRGEGKIGFGLSSLLTSTLFTIIVQPLEPPTAEFFRKGMKLQVVRRLRNDPRALDPAMKSGNYLNSLLAYLEATAEDFDDALLANHDGHITEGTTFNIFYVRRGIVATPPLDIGVLDGITRRCTLAAARSLGIETREVRFPKERLYEADEVFISSTIREVFPVTRVDGKAIGGGKPGPVTGKLLEAFREHVSEALGRC